MKFKSLIAVFVIAIFAISCSQKAYIRPGDTLPVAFGKAKNLYEKGKWQDAIQAFETVLQIGRGTEFGKEAQFYLASAHYNSREYLLSAAEYDRFASFYPNDERVKEAEFNAAMSYYNLSPRYKLDQSYSKKAIEKFQLYLVSYPASEEADQANAYIDELREKLAHKLYFAAEYYMRTADLQVNNNQYESAAIYYELILDNYPETSYAELSLANEIKAYVLSADNSVEDKQLERYQKATELYETYLQLFPEGKNRELADDFYSKAKKEVDRLNSK